MTGMQLHGVTRIVLLADDGTEMAVDTTDVYLYSNGYVQYDSGEWKAIVPPHRVAEITLETESLEGRSQ